MSESGLSSQVVRGDAARKALSKVRRWHFNPLLTRPEEAEAWLRSGPFSDGHAIAIDGTLIIRGTPKYTVVSLEGIEDSLFLSGVALGDAADGIAERVAKSPQLAPFHGWDVELVAPGAVFTTEFSASGICCFASTDKKDGSYFDLVVYGGGTVTNYAQRTPLVGLEHSGDIGSLLHHITATDRLQKNLKYVVGVVGYTQRMLRLFVDQLPAICVPCRKTKVLRIVPCPLDAATVGDNTMSCFLSLERIGGDLIRWVVPNAPVCHRGIDTSTNNDVTKRAEDELRSRAVSQIKEVQEARARANREAREAVAVAKSDDDAPAPVAQNRLPTKAANPTANEVALVELHETNTMALARRDRSGEKTLVASFGVGLTVPADFSSVADQRSPVLPCVSGGPIEGPAALALGRSIRSGSLDLSSAGSTYFEALQTAPVRVVHCSDLMAESLIGASTVLLNAIYVVHPLDEERLLAAATTKSTIPNQSQLDAVLNCVSIAAVSAMAGPLSLVVIELPAAIVAAATGTATSSASTEKPKRFWYRGPIEAWKGLAPSSFAGSTASFGADVTGLLSDNAILQYAMQLLSAGGTQSAATAMKAPAPFRVASSKLVQFENRDVTVDEATAKIGSMSAEELTAARSDVTLFLEQCTSILTATELTPVVRRLVETVTKITDKEKEAYKAKLRQALASGGDVVALARDRRRAYARQGEEAGKVQWFLDLLGTQLSVKGSSTRGHDLARLQRKAAISHNVEQAEKLSADDVWDLLERECHDESSCYMVQVDGPKLLQTLSAVATEMTVHNKFHGAVDGLPERTVAAAERMMVLDSVTVAALGEGSAKAGTSHALTPVAGTSRVSLALAGSDHQCLFPFPMLKRFVEINDPTYCEWEAIAEEPAVSQLRILMRGTLTNSITSRQLQLRPEMRDVGYALLHLQLEALESLVPRTADGRGEADWANFDNTKAQIARGMMGWILSTCASSATPLSQAHRLVSGHNPPAAPRFDRLWIFSRVAAMMPSTGWNLLPMYENIRRVIVGLLRVHVVDAAMKPSESTLAKEAASSKSAQAKRAQVVADAQAQETRFLELCFDILRAVTGSARRLRSVAGRRMVKRFPAPAAFVASALQHTMGVRQAAIAERLHSFWYDIGAETIGRSDAERQLPELRSILSGLLDVACDRSAAPHFNPASVVDEVIAAPMTDAEKEPLPALDGKSDRSADLGDGAAPSELFAACAKYLRDKRAPPRAQALAKQLPTLTLDTVFVRAEEPVTGAQLCHFEQLLATATGTKSSAVHSATLRKLVARLLMRQADAQLVKTFCQ